MPATLRLDLDHDDLASARKHFHHGLLAGKGNGGGGGGKPGGDPPPCTPQPIQVLVENACGDAMWVQVNDGDVACDIVCQMTKTKKQTCPLFITWIGGVVVEDPQDLHGFHFDPDTIIVAEITAEGLQTNICQIANAPSFYAGGLWYIPSGFVDYTPL